MAKPKPDSFQEIVNQGVYGASRLANDFTRRNSNDLNVGLGASMLKPSAPSAGGMLADSLPFQPFSATASSSQPTNAATRWTANAQAARSEKANTNSMLYGSYGSGETFGMTRNPAINDWNEAVQQRWKQQQEMGYISYVSPEQEAAEIQRIAESQKRASAQASNQQADKQMEYDLNRASWSQGGRVGGRRQFAEDNNLGGRQYKRMFGKVLMAPRNNKKMID